MFKQQIKELWRLCFNDSEAFTELYFTHRYNNEVNICIQSGEMVISAMQTLPYPMTFCNNTIPTAYVSGACTHPDYQGRGVMRELLSQAFGRMQSQGVLLSTLIPATDHLFDYYKKSGYAAVFDYMVETLLPEDLCYGKKDLKIASSAEFQEDVYAYLAAKMEERSCCIQHTAADFKVVLADLTLSGGEVFVATSGKSICGIAVAYSKEQTLQVNELLTDSNEVEQALLLAACERWNCRKLSVIRPYKQEANRRRLGMVRIIDAKRVLQLYAAANPQVEMNMELTDSLLAANNGYFYINNGKCMKSEERLPGSHERLSIEALALKIFLPLKPYMSLMLN